MRMIILISILFIDFTNAFSITSNDEYLIHNSRNYDLIYTKNNENEARFLKVNLDNLLKYNEKSFGYKMDEKLTLSLISNKLQIPNAFSIQFPMNETVFYNNASQFIDYFSSANWLKTLMIHEIAHNYQLNAKKSPISKLLKSILGNNTQPVWFNIFPIFTTPNIMLPTFLLEGNAVLNESIQGNGGRLYNGEIRALVNDIILNDIPLSHIINSTDIFPYGQTAYIIGGYFWKYIAKRYGFKNINKFFYYHSYHEINPFLYDDTFKNFFNVGMYQSLEDFLQTTKKEARDFKKIQEKSIATSKKQIYLNQIDNKIYFLTNDLENKPTLYENSKKLKTTDLMNGKVFKIDGEFYTNSSALISSRRYKAGLFDESHKIYKASEGRSVQDIKNGKIAYIKLGSFTTNDLYIDDKKINNIHSSSIMDEYNNIYYFIQEGDFRVCYKNNNEIFRIKGFYSKVVDVVKNNIYFTANTKFGSSLYVWDDRFFRVLKADNIIDAKVLNNKIYVVSVNRGGYNVHIQNKERFEEIPYQEKAIKINEPFKFEKNSEAINSKLYNELTNLKYSFLYPTYSYDSKKGSSFSLNANFSDALLFNNFNLFYSKVYEDRSYGLSYTNERYIPFSATYIKIDDKIKLLNERGYQSSFRIYDDFIFGKHKLRASLYKYYDNDFIKKEPLLFGLNYNYTQQYPLAFGDDFSFDFSYFYKKDRGNIINYMGLNSEFKIFDKTYLRVGFKYIKSDTFLLQDYRGIKIVNEDNELFEDKTNILIEGLNRNYLTDKVFKQSFTLTKGFNFSKYFETFPISSKKEKLFFTYNKFQINKQNVVDIKEQIFGFNLDIVLFHKFSVPISFRYITNDFNDEKRFKVSVGSF